MTKTLQLAKDMEQCTLEMFGLFKEHDLATESFLANLKKIEKYYWLRFLENKVSQEHVLKEYQTLVSTLKQVKEGSISADKGLEVVNNFAYKRKVGIAVDNVLNGCALLFWMATAITSYVVCLGLAIPLIFFNPVAGVALTLGASAVMLAATLKGAECVRQFESFKAINKEEQLERNAFSFFTPAKADTKAEAELTVELSQQNLACC